MDTDRSGDSGERRFDPEQGLAALRRGVKKALAANAARRAEIESNQPTAVPTGSPSMELYTERVDYRSIITMEPGKRSGKPCIRGMRVTVSDVLDYLAAGLTPQEIVKELPYLTEEDIRACLAFAADRERRLIAPIQ